MDALFWMKDDQGAVPNLAIFELLTGQKEP